MCHTDYFQHRCLVPTHTSSLSFICQDIKNGHLCKKKTRNDYHDHGPCPICPICRAGDRTLATQHGFTDRFTSEEGNEGIDEWWDGKYDYPITVPEVEDAAVRVWARNVRSIEARYTFNTSTPNAMTDAGGIHSGDVAYRSGGIPSVVTFAQVPRPGVLSDAAFLANAPAGRGPGVVPKDWVSTDGGLAPKGGYARRGGSGAVRRGLVRGRGGGFSRHASPPPPPPPPPPLRRSRGLTGRGSVNRNQVARGRPGRGGGVLPDVLPVPVVVRGVYDAAGRFPLPMKQDAEAGDGGSGGLDGAADCPSGGDSWTTSERGSGNGSSDDGVASNDRLTPPSGNLQDRVASDSGSNDGCMTIAGG